jgi:ADP-ribosyl-[dinitrogen reductase] hydrolase
LATFNYPADKLIIGAIAGDMHGCEGYSGNTIFTIAVMDSLLNGREYTSFLQAYGRKYHDSSFGPSFTRWLRQDEPLPFNSWNNGAALRVSPIGIVCRTLQEVLDEARSNASVSHSHPDGIKGAQAVAAAVFLARNGRTKDEIRSYIESEFNYNLHKTVEEIQKDYYYDQSCQSSVPESIIAFLDSINYESAIGIAGSLKGSKNSIASMTGAIAQAFYKEIPGHIARDITNKLSPELHEVVEEFSKTYPLSLFRY